MESPSKTPTAAQDGPSSTTEANEEKQRGLDINGPGLFERTYQVCIVHELRKIGMFVESEVARPVMYDGIKIDAAYRADLRVEKNALVEIKAVEALTEVHQAHC